MEYLLYRLDPQDPNFWRGIEPKIAGEIVGFSPFDPAWLMRGFKAGGSQYIKVLALAAWTVISGPVKAAEYRAYAYLGIDGGILHYSIVSPTTMHLPWLEATEAGTEIGGCLTVPSARGKRIYSRILAHIGVSDRHQLPLYMIVEASNTASQHGMERAGFVLVHKLRRLNMMGRPPQYQRSVDNCTEIVNIRDASS